MTLLIIQTHLHLDNNESNILVLLSVKQKLIFINVTAQFLATYKIVTSFLHKIGP